MRKDAQKFAPYLHTCMHVFSTAKTILKHFYTVKKLLLYHENH